MDEQTPRRRHHLLIAGTGRAGTTFLVRYLTELGLDTHLQRQGENAAWDDHANAGLEDIPFPRLAVDLPYVVKVPWLYQFVDELLADASFVPDAVVIPVRDLAEAAMSRSVLEHRAMHEAAPWMTNFDRSWEDWAYTPGGIIYSMNPVDQGRLLAVGFHHLVQRLTAAGIPIILLAFPRLAEDAAYVFERLRPVLPETVTAESACRAHLLVADPAKIRVGAEFDAEAARQKTRSARVMQYQSPEALDQVAIRRELERSRKQLAEASAALATAGAELAAERASHQAAAEEATRLRDRVLALEAAVAGAIASAEAKAHAIEAQSAEAALRLGQVQALSDELTHLRWQAEQDRERKRELEEALAQIRSSRSWRLTRPYRAVGSRVMNALLGGVRRSVGSLENTGLRNK